jgi:hypothetical protein
LFCSQFTEAQTDWLSFVANFAAIVGGLLVQKRDCFGGLVVPFIRVRFQIGPIADRFFHGHFKGLLQGLLSAALVAAIW